MNQAPVGMDKYQRNDPVAKQHISSQSARNEHADDPCESEEIERKKERKYPEKKEARQICSVTHTRQKADTLIFLPHGKYRAFDIECEIKFGAFTENLALLGILPKHIWQHHADTNNEKQDEDNRVVFVTMQPFEAIEESWMISVVHR